ncbi:unnamed protein product [Orchesella dallaii]|uniref:Uncharacterized protein n=1 Tax=Orchesella dallaii TaxID=48710 RepID=A0ABP1RZT7_9HEXA
MYFLNNIRNTIPLLVSLCVLNPRPIICGVASALKFGAVNNNNTPHINNIDGSNSKHEGSPYISEHADGSTWPQDVAMKYPSSSHTFSPFHSASDTGGIRTHHPARLLLRHYLLSNPHGYPIAGKFQKMDSNGLLTKALTAMADKDEIGNWVTSRFDGIDQISSPIQNPHIGTSALANLPKFWDRVRQNLRDLQDKDQDEENEAWEGDSY